MESINAHPDSGVPYRVTPADYLGRPVRRPHRLDETLEAANTRAREADRVDFSDEIRRLNEEQRLRDLRRDEPARGEPEPCPRHDAIEKISQPPLSVEVEVVETVRTIEHRYHVTHMSATGRLIDMLM
ncbi:MAG: hypothetical protein AAF937_06885 [Planctomycetota bacterium]